MYNMWALWDALENVRKTQKNTRVAWEELKTKVTAFLNERGNSRGSCTAVESGHQMFVSN